MQAVSTHNELSYSFVQDNTGNPVEPFTIMQLFDLEPGHYPK